MGLFTNHRVAFHFMKPNYLFIFRNKMVCYYLLQISKVHKWKYSVVMAIGLQLHLINLINLSLS